MSPEQWEGKKVNERSDLYSVGILLYELVTGQVPFSSHEVFSKELPRVSSLPEELYLFLQKACAKHPKNRFSSSEEMSSTLKNLTISGYSHKSTPSHLKESSESVQPESDKEKKKSEFLLDFLHPFRKELTWKSILLKQLRIFLSISVLPLVVWVGIFEDILMEMPICRNSKMVMDGLYCYHEADKNSLLEAENICSSNYKNTQKIEDKKCIEKNYTGTIKLNSFMEKPYYEYRSNYFAKYYNLKYYLILIYPLFLFFHIINLNWKDFKYLIMLIAILPLFYFLYISYIKKEIWTGIVYPDKNNLYDYKIIGSFDTLNICLDRVNTIAGEKGSYECGLNCKMESTTMICEKTIGNEK